MADGEKTKHCSNDRARVTSEGEGWVVGFRNTVCVYIWCYIINCRIISGFAYYQSATPLNSLSKAKWLK